MVPQRLAPATLAPERGREIPVVRSYVVGQDIGADNDFGAVFVLDDLDAYREYLAHPVHAAAERAGLPLMAKFETFDITDDPDPDFRNKVADLQRRHVESNAQLAARLGSLPINLGSSALPGTDPAQRLRPRRAPLFAAPDPGAVRVAGLKPRQGAHRRPGRGVRRGTGAPVRAPSAPS